MGNQGRAMPNTEEYLDSIVVDICCRAFFLMSDLGEVRTVECDSAEEFMGVWKVCTAHLTEEQISFAEPSVLTK